MYSDTFFQQCMQYWWESSKLDVGAVFLQIFQLFLLFWHCCQKAQMATNHLFQYHCLDRCHMTSHIVCIHLCSNKLSKQITADLLVVRGLPYTVFFGMSTSSKPSKILQFCIVLYRMFCRISSMLQKCCRINEESRNL